MDITTIALVFACTIGIVLLMVNVFRKRHVDRFMEANTNVPQLYLQKTVENKLRTLQHALRQTVVEGSLDDEVLNKINTDRLKIAKELSELKEAFKQQKFSLKTYNAKLDALLVKVDETIVF